MKRATSTSIPSFAQTLLTDLRFHKLTNVVSVTAISLALLTLASPLSARELVGMAINQIGPQTQVTFEIDEGTSFDAFTISNPPRLVIDVPGIDNADRAKGKRGGLVMQTRVGSHNDNANRFVLDLTSNVQVSKPALTRSQNGHVLTINLTASPGDVYKEQAFNHRDQAYIPGDQSVERRHVPAYARKAAVRTKYNGSTPLPVAQSGRRGSNRKPVIIIDPGHGGKDPGATSVSGVNEKDLTLTFGVELASMLIQSGQYQVYLTRNSDVFIPLRERTRLATTVDGDLFISIHADSNTTASARGASFYTLSESASDDEARRFAERENEAFLRSGQLQDAQQASVKSILHNMALRETMAMSRTFADQLTRQVSPIWPTRRKPHRQAGFAVLKSPAMPSVLLEMGYLSNRLDEHIMLVPEYRMTLANGIKASVDSYFRLIDSDTVAK